MRVFSASPNASSTSFRGTNLGANPYGGFSNWGMMPATSPATVVQLSQRSVQLNLARSQALSQSANFANARTAMGRYQAALEAYEQGNIPVASRLMVKTALDKDVPQSAREEARRILDEYRETGRERLVEIRTRIDRFDEEQGYEDFDDAEATNEVIDALAELQALALEYEKVPRINHELERLVNRYLHHNKTVAKFIHEPIAAELNAQAAEFEQSGQRCCAFLAYEEAEKLTPSVSASVAKRKAYLLRKDAELMEKVQVCRRVRKFQTDYDRAMKLAKMPKQKKRAVRLLQKIVEGAPPDSAVHKAARQQLVQVARPNS